MQIHNKAVLYARFSSDKQQESSITVQLAECKKFCQANHLEVVGTYVDEARTGTDGNRESFQQMLQDSYLGNFDFVVIHRWDRFARNVELALSAKEALSKLGIKIISTVENFDDTPEGDFFNLMSMGMAALYSKRLSREAFNGQLENARMGKAHAGVPLYGYEVVQKKYRLVPQEAEAVRIMFKMVADGYSYKKTVDYLNEQGYHRRNGKPLSYNISDTLRNRQYMGEYIFNLYQRSHVPKVGRQRKRKSENEIIRIPNGIPAIIDEETFLKVQEIMDNRKQRNPTKLRKGKYLLTGLIYCGICHCAYCGNKYTTGGREYFSYYCNSKTYHENKGKISVVLLDKYIVNLFTKAFLLLGNVHKVAELIRYRLANIHDEKVLRIKELTKIQTQSKETVTNLEEIIHKNKGKALASVLINDITNENDKLVEVEKEIEQLKSERLKLPKINIEKLSQRMQTFKNTLNGFDFYARQELLRHLIAEIIINKNDIETTINLHYLADISVPITCKVITSRNNIMSGYKVTQISFDFDGLNIVNPYNVNATKNQE